MNRRLKYSLVFLSTCLVITGATCGTGLSQVITMEKESDLMSVLKSGSDADKAIACKRLAIYGSAEAAPELAKLLSNDSLASWARIALEAIPGSQVDETLQKATESLKGRLLIGTINSMGVRRDAGAVEIMSARLKDQDADVASAAAVALGRIGNTAATQILRKSIVSAPASVRSAVAEGCVLCAERSLLAGDATLAAAIYEDVRKADVPMQRIVEATRGAILAKKQDGIPLLLETLRSQEKVLFQVALKVAREMSGGEIDKALGAELATVAPDRAALVIQAMADRKATVNLAAIVKASEAGPKQVRVSAINALGRVGDATCVSSLLEITSQEDKELADAAIAALADLPDQSISKDILARLSKADGKLLSALIDVVGQRRIEATGELVKSLKNPNSSIRAASLRSLGATVPADGLSVLISQVVSPGHAEDLEAAKQALKTAAVRMPDREACAAQIAKTMDSASVQTKSALLDILGAVGGTKSLEAMNAAAKSDDPQLRDVSSRLLGEWLTVDASPVLLELVKNGPADKFQGRLFKGYLRMAKQFA
ncbi:MAG TPA: HEAT repeat domain-containing protein, partial [Pirellula sp.]|nr:HEAT repeat domain-containing protein [Pirellula sp.]